MRRAMGVIFVLTIVLMGSMGLDCDTNQALAVFRQTAVSGIGDGAKTFTGAVYDSVGDFGQFSAGLKTMTNAVIDGVAEAVESAGRNSTSSSTSGSSSGNKK